MIFGRNKASLYVMGGCHLFTNSATRQICFWHEKNVRILHRWHLNDSWQLELEGLVHGVSEVFRGRKLFQDGLCGISSFTWPTTQNVPATLAKARHDSTSQGQNKHDPKEDYQYKSEVVEEIRAVYIRFLIIHVKGPMRSIA